MTSLQERLKNLMQSFERKAENYAEYEVFESLVDLYKENISGDEKSQFMLRAELMAFGFYANDANDENGGGTYYIPWSHKFSDIQLINPEILKYWLDRSQATNHSLLRIRYADLVWEFTKNVTTTSPRLIAAHLVIDATLEFIKNKRYVYEIDAIQKLERSLSISLSIHDKDRTEAVKKAILIIEDETGDDNKPGLWGIAFDKLLLNKKIRLSEEEKKKILADLESRLYRLVEENKGNGNIDAAEAAAMRLARYYQQIGQMEEMQRVLRQYKDFVISVAERSGAIVGLAHLKDLHQILNTYQMREDAAMLMSKIVEMGEKTEDEMHELSHTITISTEELEDYLETVTKGSLEEVLKNIALRFIPNLEQTEQQVFDLAQKAPLTFHLTHGILNSEGRPIAQIDPIEEDLEGHIVLQLSKNMQIASFFLREAIIRMRRKFFPSLEIILNYIYQSPVFQPEYKSLVAQGVGAYLSDDHISAAHIIIPQIENILRNLLEKTGGSIYKSNRMGGFSLRILDDILRDEKIVSNLNDNVSKYLRVLLVDQRGWNIRNNICHGLLRPEELNSAITDRLFHVLLLLALIRKSDT